MSRKLSSRRLTMECLEDRQLFDGAMVCEAFQPLTADVGSPREEETYAASANRFVLDADGNGRLDVGELNRWLQWWSQSRDPAPVQEAPVSPPKADPPTEESPKETAPTVLPRVPSYGGAEDWHLNDISAPEAWAAGHTGVGVTIAVIDTGADLNHREIRHSLWVNEDEIAGNGVDDDRNGYVDDIHGWDFVNDDNRPQDHNGHGTHVASSIVGARDGEGTTGVAYGSELMVLQGLGANGMGATRDIAEAIRYAVDEGADIVNLSLSGGASQAIESAISYAERQGVLVVAAAGNDGAALPSAPASLSSSLTNVLAVGAVNSDQALAGFSNRSTSDSIMVHAPGVNIIAAIPNGYARMSGTSMATPLVAGIAALAKSASPNLNGAQLRSLMVDHAMRTEGDWLLADAATVVARAMDLS